MKQFSLGGATIGTIVGSYLPQLFSDKELLSGWSILSGVVGGLVGIWIGVKLYKGMS